MWYFGCNQKTKFHYFSPNQRYLAKSTSDINIFKVIDFTKVFDGFRETVQLLYISTENSWWYVNAHGTS